MQRYPGRVAGTEQGMGQGSQVAPCKRQPGRIAVAEVGIIPGAPGCSVQGAPGELSGAKAVQAWRHVSSW